MGIMCWDADLVQLDIDQKLSQNRSVGWCLKVIVECAQVARWWAIDSSRGEERRE